MKKVEMANQLLKEFEKNFGLKAFEVEQGSDEWLDLKLGVISASNVSKAVAKKGSATRETYLAQLVAQVCTGEMPYTSSPHMEWGKNLESTARSFYNFNSGSKMTELPFVFKDNSFRVGASPDGIVTDKKGVEIKCPSNSENHIKTLMSDYIKPEYHWQIQYSMWVMDLESYDFCSYDPRMRVNPMHIISVQKDEKKFKQLDETIPGFLEDMDKALEKIGVKFGDQWKWKAEKLRRAI